MSEHRYDGHPGFDFEFIPGRKVRAAHGGRLRYTADFRDPALKTVTINAAKAVAIDSKIGSLEAGKDADFVIWSGNPLSQFTKAEQTWVDGRKYFSLEEDVKLREEIARQRTQLIQAILSAGTPETPAAGAGPARARVPERN